MRGTDYLCAILKSNSYLYINDEIYNE